TALSRVGRLARISRTVMRCDGDLCRQGRSRDARRCEHRERPGDALLAPKIAVPPGCSRLARCRVAAGLTMLTSPAPWLLTSRQQGATQHVAVREIRASSAGPGAVAPAPEAHHFLAGFDAAVENDEAEHLAFLHQIVQRRGPDGPFGLGLGLDARDQPAEP